MEKDPRILELRKFIYDAIKDSENPKHFDMFWDYISFPPEYGGEILFPEIQIRVKESLDKFMIKVKEAEAKFYQNNRPNIG